MIFINVRTVMLCRRYIKPCVYDNIGYFLVKPCLVEFILLVARNTDKVVLWAFDVDNSRETILIEKCREKTKIRLHVYVGRTLNSTQCEIDGDERQDI